MTPFNNLEFTHHVYNDNIPTSYVGSGSGEGIDFLLGIRKFVLEAKIRLLPSPNGARLTLLK